MNTNINNNIEATNNTMANKENNTMKTYRKAIKCIETGKTYISIAEAAREMNCSMCNISNVLKNRQKTANGYRFEYLTDEETRELLNSIEPKEVVIQRKAIIRGKGKSCNGNTNAVLCISTGDVFTSCTDAANHADVTQGHMSSVCRGNGHSVKGKRYCYVKDINEHLDEVAESIRKANMYDEFMTKEEKRKELVEAVKNAECKISCTEYAIHQLNEQLAQEKLELEKARHELMYFSF